MKSPIPRSALEHHIAFVGKTGSGKTGSAKSGIIEPALAAGERVCVIDPTGAWWGLRLDADGKSKGLPIYVFGGDHGDYPLLASQGEMIAEAIGETSTPAILDTTLLRTGERMRFFTDFADTILRVNRGPLRLVIDEAHLFAPQAGTRGAGAMPDMLHAANNLISLGRSRGLRIVLISQRPAKVHKDSLTQVESLVAMRLIAPQDRKAVEEWIADQADKETGKEIIASLPTLKNRRGLGLVSGGAFPEARHIPAADDVRLEQGAGYRQSREAAVADRPREAAGEVRQGQNRGRGQGSKDPAEAGRRARGAAAQGLVNSYAERHQSSPMRLSRSTRARAIAGAAVAPPPDDMGLIDSLKAVMTGPQLQLFEQLQLSGTTPVTREELATAVKWEPGGSNLRNRLSELSAMEVVTYPGKGNVALQEWVVA
jgi:hypothetical protein